MGGIRGREKREKEGGRGKKEREKGRGGGRKRGGEEGGERRQGEGREGGRKQEEGRGCERRRGEARRNKRKREESAKGEHVDRNYASARTSAYRNILQLFVPQGLGPMWRQKNYNIVGGPGLAASVVGRSILPETSRKLRESVGWRRLRAISRGFGGCLAGLCPPEWFARLGLSLQVPSN